MRTDSRSVQAIIALTLTCALVACDVSRPTLPTPPGTPLAPANTPTGTTPTPTPVPTPTQPEPVPSPPATPTSPPGAAERSTLAEAAAAAGWNNPIFGEEPELAGKRAYHAWSVAVIFATGADRIMEIRQYPDDATAARGLDHESGSSLTFHGLPARRQRATVMQYGVMAHLDTLVWRSGPRLFWVRDANNLGGLADALTPAEALYAAANRHGLLAPPTITVTRDLSARGTAAGFAVILQLQTHGPDLPDHAVVEERFTGATLADPLGATPRREPDGTWVLVWELSGVGVAAGELIYLVAVPCSTTGAFQAQGTVTFDAAGETVTYPIGGDTTRPVAGPTCSPAAPEADRRG